MNGVIIRRGGGGGVGGFGGGGIFRLNFRDFRDLKNFAKLKSRKQKVPRKLKTRKLVTYIKTFISVFRSARSIHTQENMS